MNLRKKAETATTITLEWDPVPGAIGYRFQSQAQPKWSHTFDSARRTVRFSKAAWYKVEALGMKDAGRYPASQPTPTSSGGKHVSTHHQRDYQPGVMRYGDGDYVLVGTWAGSQARQDFPGLDIYSYASAVTCQDSFFTGISGQRAISAGYALRDSAGNVITNAGYGAPLGDPGNPAYQAEWAQTVIAQHKGDGTYTFIDDIVQSSHVGSATPVLYPSQPSWRAAMVKFISIVGPKLKAAGLKVMLNTGAWYPGNPTFDDGRSSIDWATTLGPFGTSCMIENGFQTIDGSNTIRTMGSGWTQNWDGWAKVITETEKVADYVGMADAPAGDSSEAIYLKASTLLWVNRPGSSIMFRVDDLSSSPFGALIKKDMGAPKGPAVLNGQTWTRNFDNGSVQVDPWAMSASIS